VILLDFTCPECGESMLDELVKDAKEVKECPKCKTPMKRLWGSIAVSTPSRTERHLPSNYKSSHGARFGKLKDL